MKRVLNRRAWPVAALALLCAVVVGCKTSDPGVKNTMGTYSTLIDAEPPAVVDATNSIFESMDLKAIESTSTDLDGEVTAQTAQERKITIKVNREGENSSKVRVSVTPLGDEDISMTIINRIRDRIGADK